MAKAIKDSETEELIKKTAKDLYFKEGKFSATTQEIADRAGVNRTLINYYFRSSQNLFEMIFREAIKKEEELREELLFSEMPFKQKVEEYLDASIGRSMEYPYLESYIVTRINEGLIYQNDEGWQRFYSRFEKEYKKEVEIGHIIDIEPIQFLLNIGSLVGFPFSARPLIQCSLRISDTDYTRLMTQRKEIIMKILFKNEIDEV